eukprot:Phypoly_transcript_09013.p1 GENE.Phypoly_transcript_09013~~Phypoly_transcript_09013.p1  ORF type:complete len:470 (+),score=74.59 Phypoly_transcript_09013:121-1410(+)
MATFKNQTITLNNTTQPAKSFSLQLQYHFLVKARINSAALEKQYSRQKEEIDRIAAEDLAQGVPEMQVCETKATNFNKLEFDIKSLRDEQGIIFDSNVYAGLALVVAAEVATKAEILDNEANNARGFRVKFIECAFADFDKESARVTLNKLHNLFGPVAMDDWRFAKEKRELWVTFDSLEAKKKCLANNFVEGVGIPMTPLPGAIMTNNVEFALFLEDVVEGTTDDEIREPFRDAQIPPTNVIRVKNNAFVGFPAVEDLNQALRLKRVTVNRRRHNVVASKYCDDDETKGILGFWERRTPHLMPLYHALEGKPWDFLYIQPVFWANGALKHYFFIKFPSRQALLDAVMEPLNINGELIRVFPVERDANGRLDFPVEGTWKPKRVRPMDTVEQNNNNGNPPPPPPPASGQPAQRRRTQPRDTSSTFRLVL